MKPCCEWCGRDNVEIRSEYGRGSPYPGWVCEACYHEFPEPDTGRPDFDQLDLPKEPSNAKS